MVSARIADTGQAAEILTALAQRGIAVAEFTLGTPTLDDVFFALTGHAAVETREDES
jgi:ABC-2 type transport system ATP-binding protein